METFPESDVTDIEIAPDGRLYLFGASREVIEILADIGVAEARRRLAAWPSGAVQRAASDTSRQPQT
jgi:hypothetical protein